MYVAKKITIDLNRPRKEVVHLGQGDSFTRWIELTLLCDGVPYDPTADLSALGIQDGSDADIIKTVKYIKANGIPGEYENIPENGTTPAVALMDGETNVYIVRLDEHATDVPGFAEVFVTFYVEDSDGDIHVLHSFPITIDVVQNTTNVTDPGSPYYNIHSFYVKPVGGIPASDLAPDAIGTGLSDGAKQALLACFAHVAWASDDGQDYYDALESALYPEPEPSTLVSITADYQQDRPIYDTDDLDVIKTSDDLTVTANYSDGSSMVLADNDYTLSGTLTVGTSTITVSYGGKTTTIEVLVSQGDARVLLYSWNFKQSLIDSVGGKEFVLANSSGGTSLPTRDSSGLHFTGGAQIASCILPTYHYADGRSYEFDISSAVFAGDNSKHKRFFDFGSTVNVAIFRNTQGLTCYNNAWKTTTAATGQTLPTSMNDFSGKTFKIVAKEDKSLEYYIDGVLVGTCAGWTSANYEETAIRIGGNATGSASDGNQIYNCTITGMRIYTKEGGES